VVLSDVWRLLEGWIYLKKGRVRLRVRVDLGLGLMQG